MKGYVARKGNRWYAVVYEGIDPATGRERRKWHPAGTDRADAERLAKRLATDLEGRNDEVRSLTFGAYLTTRWLPAKRVVLADTTYDGYRRNIERHVLPAVGHIGLRRLRPQHLEALYDKLLHPADGAHPLASKTAYEIHLVIRGALAGAVRRGLVRRNVALVAMAPRLRSIAKVEQQGWTALELPRFLHVAAGHRHFLRCGSLRSPACAAASCSASGGTTSTTTRRRCRSTGGWSASTTTSARPEERLRMRGEASTSTPPPSTCLSPGGAGSPPNRRRGHRHQRVDVHRRR